MLFINVFINIKSKQKIYNSILKQLNKMKKALITGVTGQDGSYLSELLLKKGYKVHGLMRRCSSNNKKRIEHIKNKNFITHYGDITSSTNIFKLIKKIKPDEVYNLAAQSDVGVSFKCPEYTAEVTGLGTLRILESIKTLNLTNKTKFYQASTSELFGKVKESPQNEKTKFHPRSPYGISKLFAYWTTINYRESYNMHASNGILFNHESERRGENFVTRKITKAASKIVLGKQDVLELGNLSAKRDWGYAPDYVRMMWLMLQEKEPDDYIIATGQAHSVRDFCYYAFKSLGVEIGWRGTGKKEKGYIKEISENIKTDLSKNDVIIKVNPKFFRPCEVNQLLGNPKKAKEKIGWEPKVKFKKLVEIMTNFDYNKEKNE